MAASITQEHRISVDGTDYVIFAEIRNGCTAERWRIAVVTGGDWRVCASSHVSRKEAFDCLYLLAFQVTAASSRHSHR